MRILIANSHCALVGGAERYLQMVMPELAHQGHTLGFVYEYAGDPAAESIDDSVSGLARWCLARMDASDIASAVKNWKPDVVYLHGLQNGVLEAMLQTDYPCVFYGHNYHGTCATGRKCHMVPQPRPCGRKLGPMCVILHYPRRCGGLNPVTAWRDYQREVQINSRLGDYRAILVASSHMQQEFLRNGVNPDRLHLAPLPASESVPDIPPQRRDQEGRLLFVGRLTDMKGVDHLIHAIPTAARRLQRNLVLTVAGDGPDRARLEDLARRSEVRVEFMGWVDAERRLAVMRRAELLVVPSVWPEPFGMVVIEAGSVGLPSVGYAVGGIPDWLITGQSGELAPGDPPTVEGLSEAIVRALADPDHYARLCCGAWDKARSFTLQGHMEKLGAILLQAQQQSIESQAGLALGT
jgi:glycosyltransferase involved in cell wall biosynthesis